MNLLLQLDGKLPNLALMRIASEKGGELRKVGNAAGLERGLFDVEPDAVYASLIFERTRPLAERVAEVYPLAYIGGTGWDVGATLASAGIPEDGPVDYGIYPEFRPSIGFTQRGCRLRCPFCVVPRKEGKVREVQGVFDLWRGEPHPRELVLLDNDFFGQPGWQEHITDIRAGGFRVNFTQGINARFLTEETAEALASVDYRATDMKTRRLYTAWDNRKDEKRLFRGLEMLRAAGVKPDQIMVYMLIGYWDDADDREDRRAKLREFGARPYPMPYERTPELVGFQRWVLGAYDKGISWERWQRANYDPRKLGNPDQMVMA